MQKHPAGQKLPVSYSKNEEIHTGSLESGVRREVFLERGERMPCSAGMIHGGLQRPAMQRTWAAGWFAAHSKTEG